MSTEYVVPNVSLERVLEAAAADDDIVVFDHGDDYELSMPIDPQYSLAKRVKLANFLDLPPDDLQQGTNKATVLLLKVPDEINAWFMGRAVSMNHPELILERIAQILDAPWFSEHDEEYWDYMGN